MKYYFLLSLVYFVSLISLNAQEESKPKVNNAQYETLNYQIFGGYGIYYHKPDFRQLPDIPDCCPQYNQTAEGKGFYFGAGFELNLPSDFFIGLRAGFQAFDADFTIDELTKVRINNQAVDGYFTHYLSVDFQALTFEPYIRWNFFDNFSVTGGGFLSPFLKKEYSKYEKVKSPENGVFAENNSTIRNSQSGSLNLSEAGIYAGLTAGLSYALPLNKENTLFLSPEVFYNVGLTDLLDSGKWKVNSLKFGLSLSYKPVIAPKKENIYNKVLNYDTLIVENSNYQYDTFVLGVADTVRSTQEEDFAIVTTDTYNRTDTLFKKRIYTVNITSDVPSIYIKSKLVTQAFQNLDVIFFDNKSDVISDDYKKYSDKSLFNIDKLEPIPIKLHSEILNIVGYKMNKNKDSKITLKGYIDSTSEGNNRQLAIRRANVIKDYLQNVWKIDSSRIAISANHNIYPALQTLTKNEQGFEENRRVQIISNNQEILAPLKRENFEEIVSVSPRDFHVSTVNTNKKDIVKWFLTAKQLNNQLFKYQGTQMPDIITNSITDSMAITLQSSDPIIIECGITAENGNAAFTSDTIHITKDTSDIKVSRLALILFDVASDNIPTASEKEIKQFLKELKPDSQLKIKGYSDILGSEEFNLNLSKSRALKTAELIKRLNPNAKIIETVGVGSGEFPPGVSSYNTASERFFSRTVLIEIIDRIKSN